MLTMTVMQHERGAVGGFSMDVVEEEEEDVLSRLRHLHRTLQECHWRVQLVDHALCAQGDKDFLDQNLTENDHSFQKQPGKDSNHRNQAGKKHRFQNENGEDHSLHNEAGKDQSFLNEAQNDKNLKNQIRKAHEQTEVYHQDHPEKENNHQNEIKEEFESESQFWEDCYHQTVAEEKHSQQNVTTEDEKLPKQAESDNLHDLCHNSKEDLPYQARKDSDLQNVAMIDCSIGNYPKTKHYISNEATEEDNPPNSINSTCSLDSTDSLKKQHPRYLLRQDAMDDDNLMPVACLDILSATVVSSHSSRDCSVNETSARPYIMADVIPHQLLNLDVKYSEKIPRQEMMKNCHHIGDVRYRPDHKQEYSDNPHFYKGDINFSEKHKTNDASHEHQQESENKDVKSTSGKVSSFDHSPEVTQRMDIIWESLENLRSHFLALHSSLIDSSSHCLNQEFAKSFVNTDTTSVKSKKVTEIGDLCEEHHTMYETHGVSHQTTREMAQTQKVFREQSSHMQLPTRKLSHLVCYKRPENQTSSSTPHQEPVNPAVPGNNTTHRGAFLQGWRDGCLCIGSILLLLLVLLFLASCLLLVLPVVSVSVRTAGGLPAF